MTVFLGVAYEERAFRPYRKETRRLGAWMQGGKRFPPLAGAAHPGTFAAGILLKRP
jgi:hypothetical protein